MSTWGNLVRFLERNVINLFTQVGHVVLKENEAFGHLGGWVFCHKFCRA